MQQTFTDYTSPPLSLRPVLQPKFSSNFPCLELVLLCLGNCIGILPGIERWSEYIVMFETQIVEPDCRHESSCPTTSWRSRQAP